VGDAVNPGPEWHLALFVSTYLFNHTGESFTGNIFGQVVVAATIKGIVI
jgi:hypothetical protein